MSKRLWIETGVAYSLLISILCLCAGSSVLVAASTGLAAGIPISFVLYLTLR